MLRAATFTILAFVALSLCVNSISACYSDSNCGDNECCQGLSMLPGSVGFCQPYVKVGGKCITFDDYTGICGCAPYLICTSVNTTGAWEREGICQIKPGNIIG
ncbi:hypothetical protein EGW08_008080 [Elysia chlorotica]|uniref:Prokineticin domain-containing protein n=1 Tax=Elysia chlorotica TaxID=188477 RepID=A0A433TRB7_ELYCH|nr:hypothetical protein EGW08_008080 [Elysia chlorotica]